MVKEGQGSLLDNCMVLFGADGNKHDPHNLPLVLAGRGGGTIATGRHLLYERNTPLCDLYRSMLARVGARSIRLPTAPGNCPDLTIETSPANWPSLGSAKEFRKKAG